MRSKNQLKEKRGKFQVVKWKNKNKSNARPPNVPKPEYPRFVEGDKNKDAYNSLIGLADKIEDGYLTEKGYYNEGKSIRLIF